MRAASLAILLSTVAGCGAGAPSDPAPGVVWNTNLPTVGAVESTPEALPEALPEVSSGLAILGSVYAGERRLSFRGVSGAEVSVTVDGLPLASGSVDAEGRLALPRALAGDEVLLATSGDAESPAVRVIADMVTEVTTYVGMCDASAAVELRPGIFVVANDEDNVLRAYGMGGGPPMATSASLSIALGAAPDGNAHREVDIEGAAFLGPDVVWVGSYGNSKKGKARPSRHRFFGTRLAIQGGSVKAPLVAAYDAGLLASLARSDDVRLVPFGLTAAPGVPPKAVGGMNIEGLAAAPNGDVLVAFRNPTHPKTGAALVVRLSNPRDLIAGNGSPEIVDVAALDLGGLGIRSMEYLPRKGTFFVLAGPRASGGPFRLYEWSGGSSDPPTELPVLSNLLAGFSPEALFATSTGAVYLLSDDGTVEMDGEDCKDLAPAQQRFRGGGR